MGTTIIMNRRWEIKDLQIASKTDIVKGLISEYKEDPNSRPFDWIEGEDLSDLAKAAFIYTINNLKN